MRDGRKCIQWGQRDPATAGKDAAKAFRILLSGYDVRMDKISGDKELRGDPASSAAEAGFFEIVKGDWNKAFLDEVVTLWTGSYDDQGDCLAGAYNKLALTSRLTRERGVDPSIGSHSSITLGM
jgi:phage terminase large subunit-like protein